MFVRREVRSLNDDTLKYYAVAVDAMKQRDPDNPVSWSYQAAMHGSLETPPRKLYNQCIHGSWYFLPWHRMYVYYFERIARQAVIEAKGPHDWALPYWNYGIDAAHASIPDAFRQPASSANPLYVEERRRKPEPGPAINEGGRIPFQIGSEKLARNCAVYPGDLPGQLGGGTTQPRHKWREYGQLEELPHNQVHDMVGGENGWMSVIELAALDPIFWLHHTNIDRIWAQWSEDHDNPANPSWLNQRFSFFDFDGSEVELSAEDVLDFQHNLDYTYDVIPSTKPDVEPLVAPPETPPKKVDREPVISGAADGDPKVVGASEETLTLTGEPEHIPVAIDDRARQEVQEASRQTDPRHLHLAIENIEGEQNPGTVYGVYINLPDEPTEADLERHYAGSVSFFGIEHTKESPQDAHGHPLRSVLDVGHVLRKLGGGEEYGGEPLKVSFRPLTLLPPDSEEESQAAAAISTESAPEAAPVEIGRVSLRVAE